MAHDGSIIIDVDVLTKQAEEHLEDLRRIGQDSGDEISDRMKYNANKIADEWESAMNRVKEISAEMNDIEYEIKVREGQLDEQFALPKAQQDASQINAINAHIERLQNSYLKLTNESEKLTRQMDLSSVRANELKDNIDKSEQSMKRTSSAAESMGKSIKGGFRGILKYAGALFGIRTIYQSLKTLANEWMNSDDLAAQQMKANMEGIKNILVNAIAPVVQFVGDLIMNIVGYISAFLKLFFGVNLAAKKAGKTVKKGVGGSMSQAKDDAEELQTILAGFDKAEVVSIQKETGSGGGGSGGSGGFDMAPVFDISPFEKQIAKLKKLLDDLWNSDKMQRFFKAFKTVATNTFDLVKSVAGNLWDNVVLTWDAMMPNLIAGFDNLTELFVRVWEDLAITTSTWFPTIGESINSFVDSIFDTFRPLFEFISQLWMDITGIMLDIWNEHGLPLLDKFWEFINTTIGIFEKVWAIIDAIISPVLDVFKTVWDETLKDTVHDVLSFILELVGYALDIYNKFIAPIVGFLLEVLQPAFSVVFGTIGGIVASVLNAVFSQIGNVVNTIRGMLNGLIDFVAGVFTGNWSRAWQGISNIFGSVFRGLVNLAKTPINMIIDIINGFLRGLNRIKLPKFLGGFGVNIPMIPHLAKGGVLRQPTLNVAGEYAGAKRNPEIVTPQDIMLDTVRQALAEQGNSGNGDITITVPLVVDGRTLTEVTQKVSKKDLMQNNGGLRTAWT